jgi:uncharacterized protein YdeI (BOF family)
MIRIALLVVCAAVLAACSVHDARTLGSAVEGVATSIKQLQRAAPQSRVVLQGRIVQKCPVAGCWFLLHDQTGSIKVDTKNAGFVVLDVPLNSTVTIAGRVVSNGSEQQIDAVGLRY